MTYTGVVKGNVVELEKGAQLPEGAMVEVVVKEQDMQLLAPSGYPKGSPQTILAALDTPSHCTEEDVDALMKAILGRPESPHLDSLRTLRTSRRAASP